jgi:hypothetical protein
MEEVKIAELEKRILEWGIPESAIEACIKHLEETAHGLPRKVLWATAANLLCDGYEKIAPAVSLIIWK